MTPPRDHDADMRDAADDDWRRRTLPPVHHCDDCATRYDEHAECDCDDEPSAADLRWSDMEADQDAIRSACRRGL